METTRDTSARKLREFAEERWWLGDIGATLRIEEQLHTRLLAEGDAAQAAMRAMRIALMWGTRGDLTLTRAWLGRAERILADVPECEVHGYAVYLDAAARLEMGDDPATVAEAVGELGRLAERFPDRTLESFALMVRGVAAVRSGDLRGFASLDEAMLPVIGGHTDPFWGGDIFCSIIHMCEMLGDFGRMRAWTRTLEAWASALSSTFLFVGVTRIHQLQLLRAAGEWDVVEREIGEQSAAIADKHGWLAGAGYYELGEVHRLRGRDDAARAAYELVRGFGLEPQPGEALLLAAAGDPERALEGLLVALAGAGGLERARLIPASARIAAASGDVDLARQLADELSATASRFGTPGLLAGAARARATCQTSVGDWSGAEESLEDAARTYRQQGQRLELAEVHEELAAVHGGRGDSTRAAAALATARAIYTSLGATAPLARLDATSALPAGLTAREVDVLTRVASGLSNKEVARALVISDKTVGRHLSNIFTKTGTSSRTAAAAWAREHRVL